MKRKLQIFISSTYKDMLEERQSAVEAVLRAGHIPAGMELFAAGDESQLETIKRWIEDSDVYMLILGGRYGTIEKNSGISYIEIEYDHAYNLKKPSFSVVIDEAALGKKVKKNGAAFIETEHSQELKTFKDKVLSRTSRFYTDAKDIKLSIFESLSDIMTRPGLLGWIKASEMPNTDSLNEQVNRMAEENAALRKQVEEATTQPASEMPKEKYDLDKMSDLLNKTKIKTNVWNKKEELAPKEYTLLKLLLNMRSRLITGVSNTMNMSESDKFLYFNVFPKLEIYELAANSSVPGVAYRRYALTRKGMDLIAYCDSTIKKKE